MGDVKNKGSENAIQTAQGSYSFTSPEGQFIQVWIYPVCSRRLHWLDVCLN